MRDILYRRLKESEFAGVAEQADAWDLKSHGTNIPYRFDPGHRHHLYSFKTNRISRGRAVGSSSGS